MQLDDNRNWGWSKWMGICTMFQNSGWKKESFSHSSTQSSLFLHVHHPATYFMFISYPVPTSTDDGAKAAAEEIRVAAIRENFMVIG